MRVVLPHPEMFAALVESVLGCQLQRPVKGITTDSREIKEYDLYIALKGDKVDGHEFIKNAKNLGASAALLSIPNDKILIQQIKVDSPLLAIGKIANMWRKRFDIPVIGVTGSNGKTSTKDLLSHVLSSNFCVHATEGNFNTDIGLPLTLLQIDSSHTLSIVELGASVPGEIERLCEIAEPTHGVITNIAPAHLEGFGSLETIAHEKGALFRSLKNGISFVNETDELVSKIIFEGNRITFGLSPDCNFPADIYHEKDGSLTIILDTHEIPTGSHNLSFIKNSIAVSAIAISLGIDWGNLKNRIQSFLPPKGRCEVKKINQITIIDDTYNANLVSSLAALDYLKAFSGNGKRIFVFGDMFELGSSSNDQHRKIGEKCSELALDSVFTLGQSTIYTDSAIKDNIEHQHFDSKKVMIETLKKKISKGDKILFKGSRGMEMEKVIEGVFFL